jgi:hypothetical protein
LEKIPEGKGQNSNAKVEDREGTLEGQTTAKLIHIAKSDKTIHISQLRENNCINIKRKIFHCREQTKKKRMRKTFNLGNRETERLSELTNKNKRNGLKIKNQRSRAEHGTKENNIKM